MGDEITKIEGNSFGEITIDGERYEHDVLVMPDAIKKRKKWISKEKHGTSHKFTREEMEEYLEAVDPEGLEIVIVGTGQYGKLGLLNETKRFLEEKEIDSVELKTPVAARRFVEGKEPRSKKLGIFHVTC